MGLGRGRANRFAIESQMPVIGMAFWGTQPAGFGSTARLGLRAHQKGPHQRIQVLPIDSG